ncbi:MAG: hypothetical protein QXF56_01060 [Candidatus Micrarchaeia archaeon]
MLRGQTSAEFLLILAIGVTLLLFTLYSIQGGLRSISPSISTARFADSLETIYSTADVLTEGSERVVSLIIPDGLTEYNQIRISDSLYLSTFTFRGTNFSRATNYRLLILPTNFTLSKGKHVARVYCVRQGEVIVEFLQ